MVLKISSCVFIYSNVRIQKRRTNYILLHNTCKIVFFESTSSLNKENITLILHVHKKKSMKILESITWRSYEETKYLIRCRIPCSEMLT